MLFIKHYLYFHCAPPAFTDIRALVFFGLASKGRFVRMKAHNIENGSKDNYDGTDLLRLWL